MHIQGFIRLLTSRGDWRRVKREGLNVKVKFLSTIPWCTAHDRNQGNRGFVQIICGFKND